MLTLFSPRDIKIKLHNINCQSLRYLKLSMTYYRSLIYNSIIFVSYVNNVTSSDHLPSLFFIMTAFFGFLDLSAY